tara:strand:- start:12747 stop:14129 length:1383 start_codon:yes stop_codon:yes gene_type:complete
LNAAASAGHPVICLYIHDDTGHSQRKPGAAKKWWLDKSLAALNEDLKDLGGSLTLKTVTNGSVEDVIEALVSEHDISKVFWNRRYDTSGIDTDKALKAELKDRGCEVQTFNGSLLMEPWQVTTKSGDPYKVFTPFWNALKDAYSPTHPDGKTDPTFVENVASESLSDWSFHPTKPDWSGGFSEHWSPGEDGAWEKLEAFFETGLKGYKEFRDRPDKPGTSRLSPHLSCGEISVQAIWSRTLEEAENRPEVQSDAWAFLRELAWRDFSHALLFQSSDLSKENWNDKFDAFPWTKDENAALAWQKGQTGYPIVDAGLRELWQSGYMHNRVRMIVASFFIKHLMQDWRDGEEWFWDTLVDADSANNPASWQWVAGSGADASPYFRIFNPITQGEKFDPEGDYIRQWVPELTKLSNKHLFTPWEAPQSALHEAGIELGKTYPKPFIEHKRARERALEAYESLKS